MKMLKHVGLLKLLSTCMYLRHTAKTFYFTVTQCLFNW